MGAPHPPALAAGSSQFIDALEAIIPTHTTADALASSILVRDAAAPPTVAVAGAAVASGPRHHPRPLSSSPPLVATPRAFSPPPPPQPPQLDGLLTVEPASPRAMGELRARPPSRRPPAPAGVAAFGVSEVATAAASLPSVRDVAPPRAQTAEGAYRDPARLAALIGAAEPPWLFPERPHTVQHRRGDGGSASGAAVGTTVAVTTAAMRAAQHAMAAVLETAEPPQLAALLRRPSKVLGASMPLRARAPSMERPHTGVPPYDAPFSTDVRACLSRRWSDLSKVAAAHPQPPPIARPSNARVGSAHVERVRANQARIQRRYGGREGGSLPLAEAPPPRLRARPATSCGPRAAAAIG